MLGPVLPEVRRLAVDVDEAVLVREAPRAVDAPRLAKHVGVGRADVTGLQLGSLDVSTATTAATALTAVTNAVGLLGTVQAQVGTLQNRLQYAISLAQSQVVNNTAAESRSRDANVAEESSNLTKYNILTQSGVASIAQANAANQAVLQLLR